jgi:hypothetical protein
MQIYTPPTVFPIDDGKTKIFLAGSIEGGNAEDWQATLCKELEDTDLVVLNPRRSDYDPTQDPIASNPYFRGQVEWELAALEYADIIFMYFDPNTKSAISLLELGLFHKKAIVVCCPDGFWRQGNVQIVCEWYDIPYTTNKELFFERVIKLCKSL